MQLAKRNDQKVNKRVIAFSIISAIKLLYLNIYVFDVKCTCTSFEECHVSTLRASDITSVRSSTIHNFFSLQNSRLLQLMFRTLSYLVQMHII